MHIKRTKGELVFDIINTLLMLGMIFLMGFPIWHVVMASFSDSNEILRAGGVLFAPLKFTTAAYAKVFTNPNIFNGYKITLFVVIFGTTANVLFTAIAAYCLSRKDFMWRGFLNKLVMFTMLFSGGMIPSYIIFNNVYHLGNNILVLILPGLINTWNLMVMRTSFEGIPESLIESAKLDGANDIMVLFRIVLPSSMAIIAVMVLYYGVAHWNAWFNGMLYMRDRNLYPLQLILREILLINSSGEMLAGVAQEEQAAVSESLKYATIVVSTLPILLVYPFLQKYFVKGVMIGAVKG